MSATVAGEHADEDDARARGAAQMASSARYGPPTSSHEDVDAGGAGLALDHLVERLGELAAGGDEAVIEAELLRPIELGRGARGAEGDGADGAGDLHRRGPHAAADGADEDALAAAEMADGDHGVVGGDERLGDGGRLGEAEVRRHAREGAAVDHELLGVGAAAGETEDPVARPSSVVTPSPSASTSPANSSPGMSLGESAGAGYMPRRWRRSARLIAVARTRTRTSPRAGSGVGTSRSSRTSGPPGFVMTMARMVHSGLSPPPP